MKKIRNLLSCTLVSALLMTTLLPCSAAFTGASSGNQNIVLKTEDFLMMVVPVLSPESQALKVKPGEELYQPYVEKALELGLLKPEKDEVLHNLTYSLTRELAVQIIDRSLTLKGETFTADKGLAYKFSDYTLVNDINKDAVLRTYEAGIIQGSKGKFNPKSYLTRADGLALVSKLKDKSLRKPVTVFRNPKSYGKIADWYIEAYEKTITNRSVIVVDKGNGVVNKGDVDFTEKPFKYKGKTVKWWTDQEFEDIMLTNVGAPVTLQYTSVFSGGERLDMTNVQGYFFPHNGELAFTLHEDKRDGKARRNYNNPIPNMNRIAYDFAKYSSQMALLSGDYAYMGSFRPRIICALDYVENPTEVSFMVDFYTNAENNRFKTDGKFAPDLSFMLADDHIQSYGPAIQQMLIRLYGEKDGFKIYGKFKEVIKGRDGGSEGLINFEVNGYKFSMHDGNSSNPIIEMTLRK